MKKQGIVSLISGLIILLFAGFVYAWSILSKPIGAEFAAWSEAQLSLTFTLCMAFFCLGGLGGGMLLKKFSPAFNIRAAAILFAAGFFIASRAQSPVVLYIGYGALCGTASGFAYNAVLAGVPRFFPKNGGLISGILLMGFGSSSLIIGSAFTALTPDSIGAWRNSLLAMGIIMAAVLLIGSFFIRMPNVQAAAAAASDNDVPTARMIKRPVFWIFFAWSCLLNVAGLAVIGQARPIAESVNAALSPATLSLVVGMISVCNGLGRILIGGVFDKKGMRTALGLTVLFYLLGVGAVALSTAVGAFAVLVIGYILLGFGYGGTPTLGAAVTRDFFGSKFYAVNLSLLNINLLVSSFGNTAVGGLHSASGSYASTFTLLLGCIAISAILMLSIKKPK